MSVVLQHACTRWCLRSCSGGPVIVVQKLQSARDAGRRHVAAMAEEGLLRRIFTAVQEARDVENEDDM